MYNDNAVVAELISYKGFTTPYKTIGHLTAVAPILLCLLIGLGWALLHTQDGSLLEVTTHSVHPLVPL